jgi:hypothetical protein
MTSEAGRLAGRGRTNRRRRLVSGNVGGANGRAAWGSVDGLAGGASAKWEAAAGPDGWGHGSACIYAAAGWLDI